MDTNRIITAMRRGVLVALVALLTLPVSGAHAAPTPRLAGDTTVVASRPVKMTVEVPSPAVLDLGRDADFSPRLHGVSLSGRGRAVGVVLARHRNRDHSYDRRDLELWVVKLGYCDAPACASGNPDGVFPMRVGATEQAHLAPGTYDLYVLTDGAPVTVHLTLKGLSGRTKLHPSSPVDELVWVPVLRRTGLGPAGLEHVAYAGATDVRFRGYGATFVGDFMKGVPVGQHYAEHWSTVSTEVSPTSADAVCATKADRFASGQSAFRLTSAGQGPGWYTYGGTSADKPGRVTLCEDATYTGHIEAYQTINLALTW